MNLEITTASKKDLKELVEIYKLPYHTTEEATWFVGSYLEYHQIDIIRDGKKIIGALFWNLREERHHGLTEIMDFWIHENFRGKGLGEKLLQYSLQQMKKLFKKHGFDLRKVMVFAGKGNTPARKLYEKLGFKLVCELKELYGPGEDEVLYLLTIQD